MASHQYCAAWVNNFDVYRFQKTQKAKGRERKCNDGQGGAQAVTKDMTIGEAKVTIRLFRTHRKQNREPMQNRGS